MAKASKKIAKSNLPPQTIQLTEVEMLRIHNAALQYQQAANATQMLQDKLTQMRDAASVRVGADIMMYTFTEDGVGTRKKQPPAALPQLPPGAKTE